MLKFVFKLVMLKFVLKLLGDKASKREVSISPPNDGKKQICVIDDDGFVRDCVAKCLKQHTVVGLRLLPLEVAELYDYDILIVDGNGIGNEKWKNGVEFLMEYTPKNPLQKLIHFSGYITEQDKRKLTKKGIKVITKGSCFYEDLILK